MSLVWWEIIALAAASEAKCRTLNCFVSVGRDLSCEKASGSIRTSYEKMWTSRNVADRQKARFRG